MKALTPDVVVVMVVLVVCHSRVVLTRVGMELEGLGLLVGCSHSGILLDIVEHSCH